jgi:DNA-directed RNA polymerase specialized sigma24 family protein
MGVEGRTMSAGPSADEARFTQLYARFHGPIRTFCNRRALPDAVDDAVVEAFRAASTRCRKATPRSCGCTPLPTE